jgi:hypothetical protein
MIRELPNHGWRRRFAYLPFTLPNGPTKTLVWWEPYWSRCGGDCTEISLAPPNHRTTAPDEVDLTTPYTPVTIHYEEGDYLQYVERDVPVVAEAVSHAFAVLRDMKTREIIGFRLADWSYRSESLK